MCQSTVKTHNIYIYILLSFLTSETPLYVNNYNNHREDIFREINENSGIVYNDTKLNSYTNKLPDGVSM